MSWSLNSAIAGGYGALRTLRNLGAAVLLTTTAAMAQDGPVTIAALGDSLTQGFGLPLEQGFVPQLETWLRDRGADATVINAGVSGDTTAGGAARIAWTLTPDVDALIVALGGNDLLRGIDPAASRANMEQILTVASDAGLPILVIGLPAPLNYGPDYKLAFDAIYPELSAEYGALFIENFLEPITAGDQAANAGLYMQADGVHPNPEGVKLVVGHVGPSVEALLDRVE
jgi:acyl-CoA thioesterase-1